MKKPPTRSTLRLGLKYVSHDLYKEGLEVITRQEEECMKLKKELVRTKRLLRECLYIISRELEGRDRAKVVIKLREMFLA